MKNSSEQRIQQRFPLLTAVAMIICFALFPIFLINAALDRILAAQSANNLGKTEQKLEQTLDFIELCSNDDHFAHLLLKNVLLSAGDLSNRSRKLKQKIKFLKSRFPGTFIFIAWDKNGNTIKELTDEKSYAYILKETFKLAKDVASHCKGSFPADLHKIPDIEKRLKILRHYLGRLIPMARINAPLLPGKLASTILAEPVGAKNRLWYAIESEISLLCFIDSNFFSKQTGIRFALEQLKRSNPDIECGVFGYPIDENNLIQASNKSPKSEIVTVMGKFENLHPGDTLVQGTRIYAYRLIDQKRRAFCSVATNKCDTAEAQKWHLIAITCKTLMVFFFVFHVYLKKNKIEFIPVSAKLAGLFIYAGGIPVLITLIIAADFLHHRKSELIYEYQSIKIAQLRKIDDDFSSFLKQQQEYLQQILKHFYQRNQRFYQDPALKNDFYLQIRKKLTPDNLMLFDTKGKNLFTEDNNTVLSDVTIINQLSNESMLFMNHADTSNIILSEIARPLAAEMLYKMGQIINLSFGENKTYSCYQLLGDQSRYSSEGSLFIFWRFEKLQKIYLQKALAEHPDLSAYFPDSDSYINASFQTDMPLTRILQKAEKSLVIRSSSIQHKKQQYAATAIRGTNLSQLTLAAVIPLGLIDEEIWQLQKSFAMFSAMFLLIASGAVFLVRRRLIVPIKEFKTAIESIGQRNFRFRVSLEGTNEYGRLGAALNQTLINLQELEIARIVQDNLLPGRTYFQNNLKLHARLTQMSHIGGDYYDFFQIKPDISGIFIGDVSGHGISSALFMAMAKATLIFENFTEPVHDSILLALNKVILKIRSSGAKEYMTGQSVFINSNSGEFSVANAGHCPPIVIRSENHSWEILTCRGLPLGFKAAPEYAPVIGKLEKGDWLILYTDGWIEAESSSGIPFGYSRFAQTLLASCDDNQELFIQKMFAAINIWQEERCDDLTLIVTRFGADNGQ